MKYLFFGLSVPIIAIMAFLLYAYSAKQTIVFNDIRLDTPTKIVLFRIYDNESLKAALEEKRDSIEMFCDSMLGEGATK